MNMDNTNKLSARQIQMAERLARRPAVTAAGNGRYALGASQQELVTGGKTHPVDGIRDFVSWVACGFNHHYRYTGKTQTRVDLFFRVTFYQRICQDCGHEDWTRSAP